MGVWEYLSKYVRKCMCIQHTIKLSADLTDNT